MTQAALAAQYLLLVLQARDSFLAFVRLMHPEFELEAFHLDLIDKLDKLGKRTLRNANGQLVYNMLVNMPPRHGKTQLITKLFPVWLLIRDPREFIMSSSYNGDLAKEFGRACRNYAEDNRSRQINPDFTIMSDARAADEWETTAGGRYVGVGLNGTTTGRPATCLIVDDPIKSRPDAESLTRRNQAWSFYTASLKSRLQPTDDNKEPIQVVVLTRWHPDDVGGRIMESEDWQDGLWVHYRYQAVTEDQEGNKVALWPARFPLEKLERIRRADPREFESLYQQNPFIQGGNILKDTWWRFYQRPEDAYPIVIIAMDTAFATRSVNDPSVALVAGMTEGGDIHLLDLIRRRLEYPDLKTLVVNLNARWRGHGLKGFYIEDRASGQSLIQDLRRDAGIAVIPSKAAYDKVTRISVQTPLIEGGRVFLPADAPWIDSFTSECAAFPNGKHDDQVDALSIALDVLSRMDVPSLAGHQPALNTSLRQSFSSYGKSLAKLMGVSRNDQPLGT